MNTNAHTSPTIEHGHFHKVTTPLGDIMRDKRKSYGRSLEEVERALNIRPAMLLAIEEGRFHDLPGTTYAIGFIRAYAQYLGLSAELMVKLYREQALAEQQPLRHRRSNISSVANDNSVPRLSLVALSLLAFLAIAVFLSGNQSEATLVIDNPPLAPMANNSAFGLKNTSPFGDNALNQGGGSLYY